MKYMTEFPAKNCERLDAISAVIDDLLTSSDLKIPIILLSLFRGTSKACKDLKKQIEKEKDNPNW